MNNKTVIFDKQFRDDLRWWCKKDKKISERVFNLVEDTIANPFEGIGKPENLKYFSGSKWSRKITQEHRLVYQVSDQKIIFLQCRYHYQ